MHKSEFIQEYETDKILWDFEIITDPRILAERTDLGLINKKKEFVTWWILLFQRNKYIDLARELIMLSTMKMTMIKFFVRLGKKAKGI